MIVKNIIVKAGNVTVSDIAPSISQFAIKINPNEYVNRINKDPICLKFNGQEIIIEFFRSEKGLEFKIKTPITSKLIKNKMTTEIINKISTNTIKKEHILEIAKIKLPDLLTLNLEKAVKIIIGTAKSCNIIVIE
jgi:ribosomal protein L11